MLPPLAGAFPPSDRIAARERLSALAWLIDRLLDRLTSPVFYDLTAHDQKALEDTFHAAISQSESLAKLYSDLL